MRSLSNATKSIQGQMITTHCSTLACRVSDLICASCALAISICSAARSSASADGGGVAGASPGSERLVIGVFRVPFAWRARCSTAPLKPGHVQPAELGTPVASAGTSCSLPTGKRPGPSTANCSARKGRTPIPARWARISCSPPEGRRSAACRLSPRRCRCRSGSTTSTSATSTRRGSA